MKTTGTILDKIVAAKKADLAKLKQQSSPEQLERETEALSPSEEPGFFAALKAGPGPRIIAEVKRASPSAGALREPFDLDEINQAYQGAGQVAAISVITEEPHFKGSPEVLAYFAAHNSNRKPLLRKDFIIDPYQILESKLLGAQAYLLIVSLFDQDELNQLVDFGLEHGLEPLVEVHDQRELDMACRTKARCIGVNARDLKDFTVDRSRHELLRQLDDSYARVAESGITEASHAREAAAYADAVLIGTELMQAPDIARALEALR